MKTLIVGGGLSGLGAAYQAHQHGQPYTLLEAQPRLGGVVGSYRWQGFVAEDGPHSLMVRSPQLMALLDRLPTGSYTSLRPGCKERFIVRGGQLQAVPQGLGAFLTTRLWTPQAKARLLLEPLCPRRCSLEQATLGEYLQERLGRAWVDYAAGPLVRGIYGTSPYALSLRHGFKNLYTTACSSRSLLWGLIKSQIKKRPRPVFKPRILSGQTGMQSLVEAHVQSLYPEALHVGARLLSLRYRGPWHWQACWQVGQRTQEDNFERVVLTVPTHALDSLNLEADTPAHTSLWQTQLATLKTLPYTALGCLTLGVSRRHLAHPAQGFGFLVPETEPLPILGTLFNDSMFENRAPAGYATLATFVGNGFEALSHPTAVGQCVRQALQQLLGLDPSGIAFEHYTHWPYAVPQYTPAHDRYLAAAHTLEAALAGLHFKANWRSGVAVGDCLAG